MYGSGSAITENEGIFLIELKNHRQYVSVELSLVKFSLKPELKDKVGFDYFISFDYPIVV